jgi:hypothetical protein
MQGRNRVMLVTLMWPNGDYATAGSYIRFDRHKSQFGANGSLSGFIRPKIRRLILLSNTIPVALQFL